MFEQLEQTRKKEVKNVLISLACVVSIVFILMMVTPRYDRMMVLMFGGIFGLVIVLVIADRSKKKFMMAYKQEFLKIHSNLIKLFFKCLFKELLFISHHEFFL